MGQPEWSEPCAASACRVPAPNSLTLGFDPSKGPGSGGSRGRGEPRKRKTYVSHPSHRAGRPSVQTPASPTPVPAHIHHAPHAALLIDFDNVTLGIRSDLTKELRTLLNSDIIKGKVAVQRAYADWRRYPQYIVPLSESSIDLIFAPAFGTNKKNATDIRLAVDATELVFTRPEIGTFILLSGDSDFSSLVIKLKEYGKYVIGVGIRDSASDLLIQNCDEYHSYSDLSGLTKEVDLPSAQRDPWELVGEAVGLMNRNGDVMRSDRLKQVMQQIDPNFDERNAGFNRFSKFVTEAGTRGLLRVTKLDNGQFEVAPGSGAGPSPRGEPGRRESAERENGKARRGGRGGRGRGRGRESEPAPKAAPAARGASGGLSLAAAFQLIARGLAELPAPVSGETLRARMAALHGREDPLLDPARFSRLLRQANDAEIADVRKVGDDNYEITPHKSHAPITLALPAKPALDSADNGAAAATGLDSATGVWAAARPGSAALRFRRGSRAVTRPPAPLVGVVHVDEPSAPPAASPEAKPRRSRGRGGRGRGASAGKEHPATEAAAGSAAPGEPSTPRKRGPARKKTA